MTSLEYFYRLNEYLENNSVALRHCKFGLQGPKPGKGAKSPAT